MHPAGLGAELVHPGGRGGGSQQQSDLEGWGRTQPLHPDPPTRTFPYNPEFGAFYSVLLRARHCMGTGGTQGRINGGRGRERGDLELVQKKNVRYRTQERHQGEAQGGPQPALPAEGQELVPGALGAEAAPWGPQRGQRGQV